MKKTIKLSLLLILVLILTACNLNPVNLTIDSKENINVSIYHYGSGKTKEKSGENVQFTKLPAGKYELTISNDSDRYVTDINLKKDKIIDFDFNNVETSKQINEKAFRNINFGDSEEVVINKMKSDSLIDYGNQIKYEIDDKTFNMHHRYVNDKLYSVSFIGELRTADYFDTKVKLDRNLLVDLIKNQYGIPDESNSVGFFDVRNGYIRYSHQWNSVGVNNNKNISIGIGEQDSQYYPVLVIEHKKLLTEKNKQENNQNEINKNSNSF